jgi:hypothetical protein
MLEDCNIVQLSVSHPVNHIAALLTMLTASWTSSRLCSRPRPHLAVLRTGAGSNRWKITVKVVFACTWTLWPLPVVLRAQTALTVTLLGFDNDRAGRMALFAHARRVAVLSRCSAVAGVRASAAADVGFRTKESGRRPARWVPAGATRPLSAECASSPAGSRARSLESLEGGMAVTFYRCFDATSALLYLALHSDRYQRWCLWCAKPWQGGRRDAGTGRL